MEHFFDTICAPATAAGSGAVSLIRISGPEALAVVDREHGFTIMLVQHMLDAPDPALRWKIVDIVRGIVSR